MSEGSLKKGPTLGKNRRSEPTSYRRWVTRITVLWSSLTVYFKYRVARDPGFLLVLKGRHVLVVVYAPPKTNWSQGPEVFRNKWEKKTSFQDKHMSNQFLLFSVTCVISRANKKDRIFTSSVIGSRSVVEETSEETGDRGGWGRGEETRRYCEASVVILSEELS